MCQYRRQVDKCSVRKGTLMPLSSGATVMYSKSSQQTYFTEDIQDITVHHVDTKSCFISSYKFSSRGCKLAECLKLNQSGCPGGEGLAI